MTKHRRSALSFCCATAFAVVLVALRTPAGASAPTTRPTTVLVDWPARIDAALRDTGSVAAVAAALSAETADAPGVWQARMRVAEEAGDLKTAVGVLESAARASADDPAVLAMLADVQDQLGRVDAAIQTRRRCVAAAKDRPSADASTLKLAALLIDTGRRDEATRLLDRTVGDSRALAGPAAIICALSGQSAAASRYFSIDSVKPVPVLLLEADSVLQAGDTETAATRFDKILSTAGPADRRYALARRIATARRAGTLATLADAWLADKHLPPDEWLPLATVLRELGRVPELLDWWRSTANASARADTSDRLAAEVMGAARAAGRMQDVLSICQSALAQTPTRQTWFVATLHAHMDLGQIDAADALLRERIAEAAALPDRVQALGKLARSLGRDRVAGEAANRLIEFGGEAAIAGQLLAADLEASAGKADAAARRLGAAADAASAYPATLGRVADALETAGMDDRAIAMLRTRARVEPQEADTLARLAALLTRGRRPAEAADVLEGLMHSTATPAVRAQAAGDWLEAAAAAGSVPDLLRRVRGRLDAGRGDAQDLSPLVNACLQQHDVAGAVSAIAQSPLLDPAARLRRLSVVYLRSNDLNAAAGVLRQLVEADPADADRTLERLAGVELKRGKIAETAEAIERLRVRVGDGPASLSLMAGVYSRLGRAQDAADTFRRAVAMRPSDADAWLLWAGAAAKAGDPAAVRRRLQVLCASATDDVVIAAAVDGLLSLSADPAALRAARRAVLLRLAERPDALLLYQLVGDLSAELDDTSGLIHTTTAAIAVDADGRTQKLRELVDLASTHGDLETAIESGQLLLAFGEALPPGLFLQLGEQLLVAGRSADATVAFERAAEAGTPADAGLRAAELLEKYGYTEQALETLTPLVARRRPGADLFERLARLHEAVGHPDKALDAFLSAAAMTGVDVENERAAAPAANSPFNPQSHATPRTREDTDFLRQVAGALVSTRTPADQERVLGTLNGLIQNALSRSVATDGEPPPGMPVLVKAMRQAATYFGQPRRSDAADGVVLRRWPGAIAFQRQSPPGADPLPALIVRGETEKARVLLARALAEPPTTNPTEPDRASAAYRLLLRAAAALEDTDKTTALARQWLQAALALQDQDRVRGTCLDCVKASWPLLESAGRGRFVGDLIDAVRRAAEPGRRSFLAMTALPLARAIEERPDDALDLAKLATGVDTRRSSTILNNAGRVFTMLPASDRPAYLRFVSDALPEDQRLALLMKVLDVTSDPLDVPTSAVMIELADHIPPGQQTAWNGWFFNDRSPEVLRAVAAAALRSAGQDYPGGLTVSEKMTAVAAAMRNAGDGDQADRVAAQLLRTWIDGRSVSDRGSQPRSTSTPDRLSLLRVAVGALSPDARAKLLTALESAGPDEDGPALRGTLRSVLLDGVGNREAALQAMRDGLKREPNDPLLLQAYQERLRDDGRLAELLSLRTTSSAASIDQSTAAHQLQDLYRWREARAAFTAVTDAPDFATAAARGDANALAVAWRSFLQDARARPGQIPQIYLPASGGLTGNPRPGDGMPPDLLKEMGHWPGAVDDVLRAIHLPTSDDADGADEAEPYLVSALVGSVRTQDDARRLVEHFQTIADSETLSPGDRRAITALACLPDRPVPATLLDKLLPAAIADRSGRELDRLAFALARQDVPNAAAARSWARTRSVPSDLTASGEAGQRGTPLEILPDATSAAALGRLSDQSPDAATAEISAFRRSGQMRRSAFNLRLVAARTAAENGDLEVYRARLRDTLHDWAWRSASPKPAVVFDVSEGTLDLPLALPKRCSDPQRRAAVAVFKACVTEIAGQWPAQTELTRQCAAAAAWTFRKGDRAAADDLLATAITLGQPQGPGEHQLCVADAAELLGQDALTIRIRSELLAQRCLPADRIEPLVSKLLREQQVEMARRFVSDATTYCQEPRLQAIAKSVSLKPVRN